MNGSASNWDDEPEEYVEGIPYTDVTAPGGADREETILLKSSQPICQPNQDQMTGFGLTVRRMLLPMSRVLPH